MYINLIRSLFLYFECMLSKKHWIKTLTCDWHSTYLNCLLYCDFFFILFVTTICIHEYINGHLSLWSVVGRDGYTNKIIHRHYPVSGSYWCFAMICCVFSFVLGESRGWFKRIRDKLRCTHTKGIFDLWIKTRHKNLTKELN